MASRPSCGCFFWLLLVALLLAASLWIDRAAPKTEAVVHSKVESARLFHEPDGGWRLNQTVWVRLKPSGRDSTLAALNVSPSRFDSLSVGSRVRVRYVPFFPYYVRATDYSTTALLRDLFAPNTTMMRWLYWILVGALAMYVAARIGFAAAAVVALAWLGAAYVLILSPVTVPTPGAVHAPARVRYTQYVREMVSSRGRSRIPLDVTYLFVEMRFLPAGARDSLLVVDAVDSASITRPENGAIVTVGYDPAEPRSARLVNGTRTFVNRNRGAFLWVVLVPVGLGLLMALALGRTRRRRAPRASSAADYLGEDRRPRPF
jgi:hypothetical protein